MQTTETIDQLAAALALAQGAFESITKDATASVSKGGTFLYKFNYATFDEIVAMAKEATEWLDKVAAKTVHPFFVDSTPGIADDGPLAASARRSDDFTRGCARGPERCC